MRYKSRARKPHAKSEMIGEILIVQNLQPKFESDLIKIFKQTWSGGAKFFIQLKISLLIHTWLDFMKWIIFQYPFLDLLPIHKHFNIVL